MFARLVRRISSEITSPIIYWSRYRRIFSTYLALAALSNLASPGFAQTNGASGNPLSIVAIGSVNDVYFLLPTAVSPSGTAVAGMACQNASIKTCQLFVWKGSMQLAGTPTGSNVIRVFSVNDEGRAAGYACNTSNVCSEFWWSRLSNGFNTQNTSGNIYGLSGDGNLSVGTDASGRAATWNVVTLPSTPVKPFDPNYSPSVATAANYYGNVVVGYAQGGPINSQAFRQTGGNTIGLGFPPQYLDSWGTQAIGSNLDGTVVFGQTQINSIARAFRWQEDDHNGKMEILDRDPFTNNVPSAVDGNGTSVVGTANIPNPSGSTLVAAQSGARTILSP